MPNIAWQPSSRGHLYTRLKDLDTISSVDVLVLGSSHAYRSFDPRIFAGRGVRAFVLASSAQTPIQTLRLVRKYIYKLRPKVVIYEIYPRLFGSDGLESTVDFLSNDTIDLPLFLMSLRLKNTLSMNTLLYAYLRTNLLGLNHPEESKIKIYSDSTSDKYITGGFVTSTVVNNGQESEKFNINIRKDQIEAFNGVVDILQQAGSRVVFVRAPVTSDHFNHLKRATNGDVNLPKSALYFDFSHLDFLNDTLNFSDSHHLNQSGVEIFNPILLDSLSSYGILR